MLLKCTKLEKQARKNMQEISFEPYARLNLKYALLTPSICDINKLNFTTNFDRCAILNVRNCLTKNFESLRAY